MFRHFSKRKTTGVAAILIACIAGASAYAFTAANVVPAHKAGTGETVVGNFTVSAPVYTFSPDGASVDKLEFDLDADASDVQVALTTGAPTLANQWFDCGASDVSKHVTCDFAGGSGAKARGFDNLSVAAVSTGTVAIG